MVPRTTTLSGSDARAAGRAAAGPPVLISLFDTSVWTWAARDPDLYADLAEAVAADVVATCDPVKLELLYTARSRTEFAEMREELDALRQCPIGQLQWKRALRIYDRLAERGALHHRQVAHPDLLIAVAAEAAGVPVVHYDHHFDIIAAVTDQPTRWIRPRGSLA